MDTLRRASRKLPDFLESRKVYVAQQSVLEANAAAIQSGAINFS
jgi:hypothetical protein